MRNLKRALSLLLSSTLVLGMLVMGSSAAGYQDVDDSNKNQEAIEVLQAVGIMTGDQNGNFNPDGSITRNEMAVIMAHLLNLDYDYYRGTNPFTDVPEWAAPYVAACAAEGVVAGIGNGQFGGDQKVTAAQASLMIMKALGYFQNAEDFGTDWQVATIRQASYIDLFNNINANAESALTRAQVAQLVLNGLKAKMVDFTGDKGIQIGDVTVGYKAEYTAKTSAAAKYNTIDDGTTNIAENDQYYIQLGEELYNGSLKLNSKASDVFGRPARDWEYDGKDIGTYAKYELMAKEYTTEVTGEDLYDLLGKSTIADYGFALYIDGETEKDVLNHVSDAEAYFTAGNLVKTNSETVGATGNGVLTQVFVDNQAKEITVVIVNTYVAVATEDYDAKTEDVELKVWGIEDAGKKQYVKNVDSSEIVDFVASAEDFDVADVEEDDVFLVTVAEGVLQTMTAPKVIADTEITSFKQGSNLTTGGTKYSFADTACYDGAALKAYTNTSDPQINLKDTTYNVILDAYGYVIGVEEIDPAENYVFVTGYDGNYSNLATKTADVGAIFTDGTMKTIKVNVSKSDEKLFEDVLSSPIENAINNSAADYNAAIVNTWCTYTVNDEGVYTLTIAENQGVDTIDASNADTSKTLTIDKGHISLTGKSGRVYGNDDSVYLNVDTKKIDTASDATATIIEDVESVTVGVKNVNLEVAEIGKGSEAKDYVPVNEVYTLHNSNGWVIAAVVIGENQGTSSSYAFASSANVNQESYDKESKEYTWTREVVINGELTEISYVGDSIDEIDTTSMPQGKWFKVTYYADGTVKETEDLTSKFTATDDEYIDEIKNIESSFDKGNIDTGVLWDDSTVTKLTYKNGSLYTNTAQTEGFSVSPDVKVVLCLAGKDGNGAGTDAFDVVDDSYTGYNGLQKALRNLNSTGTVTAGYIQVSAILVDGVATSIIINDLTANTSIDTGSETPESATYKLSDVKFDSANDGKLTFTVQTKENSTETTAFKWTVTAQNTTSDKSYVVASGDDKLNAGSSSPSTATVSGLNVTAGSGIIVYTITVEIGGDTLTATLMG